MKDSFGHGSNSRSGTLKTSGVTVSGSYSRKVQRQPQTEGQRHVADLRNRLANAQGPGHAATLWQGIKNAMGYST